MDKEEMGQVMIEAPRSNEVTVSTSFLNVIVDNSNSDPRDLWLFARDDGLNDEEVMVVSGAFDIFDLLLMLKAFPSKGQARKNWKHGDFLPKGWNPQEPRSE